MTAASIIRKYRLDQRSWVHKGFHGILHYFFPVGEQPLKPLKAFFGDSYELTVFFFHENYCEWYWNSDDMVRLREAFIRRCQRQPTTLRMLKREWNRRLVHLHGVMRRVDQTDLAALSFRELWALYRAWYDRYLAEYGIAIGIQDAFSMQSDEFLFPHFRQVIEARGYPRRVNEYFATLTTPTAELFINREYRDRLMLATAVRNRRRPAPQEWRLLERHAQRYFWIGNNYAKAEVLNAAHFLGQIRAMPRARARRELRRLAADLRQKRIERARLIRQLRLDRRSRHLLAITDLFAYMQDERKRYVLLASHYQNRFLEEFRRRIGLPRAEAEYTFIHELPRLYRNRRRLIRSVFQQRKHFSLVVQTLRGHEVVAGLVARQVWERVFAGTTEDVRELRGSVAATGRVRGRVRIIRKRHDLANMRSGEILVTAMTRPEMMSAIRQAAAIVTDEGGVTSHAAVVSREFKIPCIIGTKIATRVLKDGDRVEVNATKGIVRKL